MHLTADEPGQPITSVEELRTYFTDSCKPRAQWRFGTEHEMHGVRLDDGHVGEALPYEGERGVRAVLSSMEPQGWKPVTEAGHIIALIREDAQVTIEPGGQLELAARPVHHADELKRDLCEYVTQLLDTSRAMQIGWLGIGFRPFGSLDDVPWMPKGRYDIMRAYMPTVGTLGHEMMKRTATVQTNLDYADPDDAGSKLRAAMSVTSLLTAIYASSPIVDGQISGYQSYRAAVWRDTDRARAGILPLAFEDRDVFSAYVEWALDVPMYFVHRGSYVPAGGMTFRRFLREGFQGQVATFDDWALHLSTLFPEARLKRYMEIRGCDGGGFDMILALAPLCRGLLYDEEARGAAIGLTASLDMDQRIALADAVARDGLSARVPGTTHTVGELARELMTIARDGLRRQEPTELPYLAPLEEIVTTGRTRSDVIVDIWNAAAGEPSTVIRELARFWTTDTGQLSAICCD